MKIVIKNPAPIGPNLTKWGDYHFGGSLADALRAEGAEVIQHFWPEWEKTEGEDLVIVLRGKRRWQPRGPALSMMWVISHPATVQRDEVDAYDAVLLASETHHAMLRGQTRTWLDVARQCTDTRLFDGSGPVEARRGIAFVANSRGVRRDMVEWAVRSDTPISIVGRHWKSVGLQKLVSREYIENEDLPRYYRTARLSLNDHWGDMAHFGYINNRLFDCLASGLPVLSDTFPELEAVFGDALLYAHDAASFRTAIDTYRLRYPEVMERTASWWAANGENYGFAARAAQIVGWLEAKGRAGGRTVDPAAAATRAFEAGVQAAICQIRGRREGAELQLLHLSPQETGVRVLSGREDVSYLSAGFGRGPWHVALDTTLSALPDTRYDLLVLDDTEALMALPKVERDAMLGHIDRKLGPKGAMLFPGGPLDDWPEGTGTWRILDAGRQRVRFRV